MTTLSERAILCATLSVRDCDDENFVDWHTREHLPERLAISGFLRGRRFVRDDADRCYLILYDVERLSVLLQPDYLERLNNPTPWTRATLPTFRDGRRSAYRLMAKAGSAEGAFVMVVSVRPDDPSIVKHEITSAVLCEWSRQPGIVSIAFAVPDRTASTHVTEESRRSGNRFAEEWILLVEGISEQGLLDFANTELTKRRCDRWGLAERQTKEIYRLQVSVGRKRQN